METLKITTLVENTVLGRNLVGEHGLAFWLEIGDESILFDTGTSAALLDNARTLGIDLGAAQTIVLSHGHYDHTGGLAHVLPLMQRPDVYLHPAALEPRYARHPDASFWEAGMPTASREVLLNHANPIMVDAPVAVVNGLRLTGPIPRETDFEDTGGDFYMDALGGVVDTLPDDQAAFIDTPSGIVVILGCAHAGLINTLRHIHRLTEDRPIQAIIGGMHLVRASLDRMTVTVCELRRLGIQQLMPCHCTGFTAMAQLWDAFPRQCTPAGTGSSCEFEL